jgi:hypothetical protein
MTATVIAMQSDNTDLRGVCASETANRHPGAAARMVAVALPGGSWN